VLICVKPGVVPQVLREVAAAVRPDGPLFVSIAAGVKIDSMQSELPARSRVVRVMPNTPCLVNCSASVFAPGAHATAADVALVEELFRAVGIVAQADEAKLDAVTGLSGSGPAYVFVLIEALADGGVRMGLPRQTALTLAAQTVLGAAKMMIETRVHPAELKDRVASPGGTTMAALHALERSGFRAALIDAVQAATERSAALGAAEAAAATATATAPRAKL
jgi:pyrroline-5-carboxylate reductase